jgi:putative peptidoglycan lipid II flippase
VSSPSLGRASSVMALGTVASRATGFLRIVAMSAALGITGVASAYNVANTAPNIVYELLLGGVLTSVVVPLLVQAAHEDDDDGRAFTSLFLSLVLTVLAVVVVVAIAAAPLISRLLVPGSDAKRELTTTFLRYFLPQILFYGVGATISAVLNVRGRFGAPMAAPVLNNLVVIATALVFITLEGPRPPTAEGLTGAQIATLGIGTTLGVVVMTVALLPSLVASGFRWTWRLGTHPRLRRAARLAVWVVVYVVANQVGYAIIVRLAEAAVDGGYTAYTYAFILFQLPHAVVTVSVVTALLPRMSRAALTGNSAAITADVSRGLRLVAAIVVPAAVFLVVLGRPLARVVLEHGVTTADAAAFTGSVLMAFAVGLLPFSAYQVLVRTCYARQDSRSPALVNVAANGVNIAVDVALFTILDGRSRVVGLALGHAVAYTVGCVLLGRRLGRTLGGLDGARVTQTVVRLLVASTIGALGAYGAARIAAAGLGDGLVGATGELLAGGLAGGALFVSSASRMRVTELQQVLRRLPGLRRLARGH